MRIFVGIPAYDRKIMCETARSLLNEQAVALAAGIDMQVSFAPGSSAPHTARDQLANDFLASGYERLFFLDSDVAFEPGALIKVAQQPVDFVGGSYRYKDPVEGYPVQWAEPGAPLQADSKTGLFEVGMVPGGFVAVSRAVFDALMQAHPTRKYQFHGREFHGFFHMPPGCGEDSMFCHEWRRTGGSVWLDPELRLTHCDGAIKYEGCIGDWLRAEMAREQIAA